MAKSDMIIWQSTEVAIRVFYALRAILPSWTLIEQYHIKIGKKRDVTDASGRTDDLRTYEREIEIGVDKDHPLLIVSMSILRFPYQPWRITSVEYHDLIPPRVNELCGKDGPFEYWSRKGWQRAELSEAYRLDSCQVIKLLGIS